MQDDILKVLLSQQEIADKVCEIGKQITKDYEGKNLLMVSVLKGSVVFMADLMRAVDTPARIDFMSVSSYGSGTKTSGVVKIVKDLDMNLEGYDLLLVEDILDSGNTLSYLLQLLQADFIRRPDFLVIHHHKRVAHAKKMLRAQFGRQHDQRSD